VCRSSVPERYAAGSRSSWRHEECARIDGATRFGAMTLIIFPVAVPGIVSAATFAFTLSWDGGVLRRSIDTTKPGAARHRYPFVAPAVRPAM